MHPVADYTLPRLNGLRLLLLSRMMWPEAPVLLLSADPIDLPLELKKQGASALILKPFDPQHLLQVLHEAISLTHEESSVDEMTSETS